MKEKWYKSPKFWICIALVLCLISMIGASSVQSSGGKVNVQDIRVVVQEGVVVNGQIYIPEKASPDNKLPLIVVSHGSFNNLEMQDQNMVELSRRGFVVISSDAYRHGSSSTYVDYAYGNMVAIIKYAISSMDFIDTEKIAVSGHSMGGMIATETLRYFMEQEALGNGKSPVSAILNVGYDPVYTDYEFEGVDEASKLTVNFGVIAAKYDEWFFQSEDVANNPAKYLESNNARTFVNQLEGVDITGAVGNGEIYRGTIDGDEYIRVIYQNNEIHPMNHFSAASAASAIDFFYECFGVPSGYTEIGAKSQTWQWKEFFNCVGLIGILLFLFPFAAIIMRKVPYFAELRAETPAPAAPKLSDGKSKAVYWVTYLINMAIPALLVIPVMFKLVGKESFVPGTTTKWFGEGNTTELGIWTAIVGICVLAVFLISYFAYGKKHGTTTDCWGYKTAFRPLWKSFVLALMTVSVAYIILFFADLCFNTDFRIWMIAMRVFTVDKIFYALAYFPFFALFYLVNSMLVNGGNRIDGRPTWLVTLLSCLSNIVGIGILIFIQYSGIISNGVFTFNSMRIVNLFPLLVLIPIGTIITQRFFKETGKIYLGSFIISMLYTMMTVSNTMFTQSILG